MIGQIRGRQALGGAGRIPRLDELGALPAERREGDDPGVEPDVADLRHAPHLLAAGLAADRHLVDPGTAELLELLEPAERALLELGPRADHGQVAAGAGIERERQAVVAASRDVPVAHVPQPVVHPLAHVGGRPLDGRVRVEELLPDAVDADQPVVGHAPDQGGVAAPAVRIAVLVPARVDEEAVLGEPADDLVGRLRRREAVQPAVVVVEAARLVDRHQHRQVVDPPQLEVLLARSGRDVDDPGAVLERDVAPGDDAMLDVRAGAELVERACVAPADELLAAPTLDERLLRIPPGSDPLPVLAPAVLGLGLHRRRHVRRQRPRRRRPDHERLAGTLREREADEERRVLPILVDARLRELVLGERGAATRAPLRRAMAHREPAPLVDDLEEAPDVLDVRVAEGEVVVPPVHPLTEPLRAARQLLRVGRDDLAAAARELGEPVLLDLPLRVEPERALHTDLDPEPLAVEPVLVALVEATERLVALEDVLERPPPRGVHRELLVRRDGAVEEAPRRPASVRGTHRLERSLALPELEDLELERG